MLTSIDVFGNADTKYLSEQPTDREKRSAIGTYQNSGLSQYTVEHEGVSYNTGSNFPVNWDPRYAIAAGVGASPDRRENYQINKTGSRIPNTRGYVSAFDNPDGFVVNGTLPADETQGVHSLTDVPVVGCLPVLNCRIYVLYN